MNMDQERYGTLGQFADLFLFNEFNYYFQESFFLRKQVAKNAAKPPSARVYIGFLNNSAIRGAMADESRADTLVEAKMADFKRTGNSAKQQTIKPRPLI